MDEGDCLFHHNLTENLLIEILVRLPVKSLLRLKCVCKYWYTLIQSPYFVSNHFHNPNNHSRLLVRRFVRNTSGFYLNPTFDECSISEFALAMFPDETLTTRVYEDIVDFIAKSILYHLIGPIDGLFLLYNLSYEKQVALWNPSTTEFKLLPLPNFNFPPYPFSRQIFGFGLDPLTNDYKVVWIADSPSDCPSAVAVYNLGSDSWRYIGDLPPSLGNWRFMGEAYHTKSDATYLNGCYYWLLEFERYHHKVVSFDMGSYEFREIQTPFDCDTTSNDIWCCPTLALRNNDSIALLVTENSMHPQETCTSDVSVAVWVMKKQEEGEEGSWTKLFTLQLGHLQLFQMLPLGFWKNDGIFFQNGSEQLIFYNISTHEIIDLGVRAGDWDRGVSNSITSLLVFNYKESLVSVRGKKEDKSHAMVRKFLCTK